MMVSDAWWWLEMVKDLVQASRKAGGHEEHGMRQADSVQAIAVERGTQKMARVDNSSTSKTPS